MMEEQDSRRISTNNDNTDSVVVDRISGLPDCILGIILSLLPTKEAVATSLLSKRWKFSWLDVHNLDLFFLHIPLVAPDSAENMAFVRFVHRVLLFIGAKPLYMFRLQWLSGVISSHVICWIDAAIIRNVREINLSLCTGDLLKLPISGFNCYSLRSLDLFNITFVYDTTVVCLPRLEFLKLSDVRFSSEEAFEKFINGCPILHYLKLIVYPERDDDNHNHIHNHDDGEDDDNVEDGEDDDNNDNHDDDAEEDFMYIVSSPSLRHLEFCIRDRCTLKLNAPSLENLKLHCRLSKIFVDKKSLSSLVEADFDFEMDEHDFSLKFIFDVVRALQHAKSLKTSGRVMRALCLAAASLSTKFKRLVKLAVHTDCFCSLQDFVHYFEILEELVIYQGNWWHPDTSDVPHDHSRWTDPVVDPRCLSKSLKMIKLFGCKGLEDEREMIRYMLEHGIALEMMQVHCKNKVDGEKWLKEICELPRKSLTCKVSTWSTKGLF